MTWRRGMPGENGAATAVIPRGPAGHVNLDNSREGLAPARLGSRSTVWSLGTSRTIVETLRAAAIGGTLSGAPSTVHAVLTGGDPLAATRAAGNIVVPADAATGRLLAAGTAVHSVISVFWASVLVQVLPRRRPVLWGAVAGLGIAALDLGLLGRRFPLIRALPVGPQWADHVAFGALVGAVVAARSS